MKKKASHSIRVGTLTEVFIKHSSATKKKKGCCVGRWMLWWDNGGNSGETEVEEKSNQGPWIPVLVFAGYGTVNRTPLPQPLKRTSPINRTHNKKRRYEKKTYLGAVMAVGCVEVVVVSDEQTPSNSHFKQGRWKWWWSKWWWWWLK